MHLKCIARKGLRVRVPPGLQVMGSGFLITTHIYFGRYVLFIL